MRKLRPVRVPGHRDSIDARCFDVRLENVLVERGRVVLVADVHVFPQTVKLQVRRRLEGDDMAGCDEQAGHCLKQRQAGPGKPRRDRRGAS